MRFIETVVYPYLTPLISGPREHFLHFRFQGPRQQLLHAQARERLQCLPGRLDVPTVSVLFSFMGGVSFPGVLSAGGSLVDEPKATSPSLRLHTS
jgi:hypothetical protein